MLWSRVIAVGSLLLSGALAGSAFAVTGILALSGETLHREPVDPLLGFGAGRIVSLLPHQKALVRHGAADEDIVLVFLGTGGVQTADPGLADVVFYDEQGIGRKVSKLVGEPGGALLLETDAIDPESAWSARAVYRSGETLALHRDRGIVPLPEPGLIAGLVSCSLLLHALHRLGPGRHRDGRRGNG